MKSLQSAWVFLVFLIFIFSNYNNSCAQGKCLNDERALLIQLNHSLNSYILFPSKRSSWVLNTDCCSSWHGITCDRVGHVISLDLSSEYISGELNSSSSLFNLRYLERLNLADNSFGTISAPIPYGLDRLSNLKYLNMSNSGFLGKFPVEISRMTRLVTLDLSDTHGFTNKLSDLDLETLVHNLTRLQELWLDGVGAFEGKKWCRTLSSSLPELRVLSLSRCSISGPLDSSLLQLRKLNKLLLSGNNISTCIPEFLEEFSNLTCLDLSYCNLYGKLPERIFRMQTLQILKLSDNKNLQGSIPEIPTDAQLQELDLSNTGMGGELPNSIGNLRFLSLLNLRSTGLFNGSIPSSFSKLNQLQHLDLSYNYFTGVIPTSLSKFNQLQYLDLSRNRFTGHLGDFFIGTSSPLEWMDLSNNQLQGRVPVSIFEFSRLNHLKLGSNNFSESNILDVPFHKLRNMDVLDLSNIRLSINTTGANFALFPQMESLTLSSCNLRDFPTFLENQSKLGNLDLSRNQIRGKIPNWIWKIGNKNLYGLIHLNLSNNFLEDPDRPLLLGSLNVLDFHSNMLHGKNPILTPNADFLDYSFNNFTAMISNLSSNLEFFFISNNQISGEIPTWICEGLSLLYLDLSHNNLSGQIPPCLLSIIPGSGLSLSLEVLNLRRNNLQGIIPDTLESCRLKKLDLNGNKLEGQLPRSLANCTILEVLDVGNNQLTGLFPDPLGSMPHIHVLVLRSNKLYGPWGGKRSNCNFPMLQIIDVSFNNFSGIISKECFSSWNGMVLNRKVAEDGEVLGFGVEFNDVIYQETLTITVKGVDMEVPKVLNSFTTIDFSNNQFEGEIPESIGSLTSLHTLNFSKNAFTGTIPSTIGNLTHLEGLDLSQNKLTGKIPVQLTGISTLAVMNLSFNKLVGKIPSGSQFQTFDPSAFEGNDGLCGFPLAKNCSSIIESPPPNVFVSEHDGFDWVLFVVTFLGFVVGASMVIGPQYFWKRGREWINERINKLLNIT